MGRKKKSLTPTLNVVNKINDDSMNYHNLSNDSVYVNTVNVRLKMSDDIKNNLNFISKKLTIDTKSTEEILKFLFVISDISQQNIEKSLVFNSIKNMVSTLSYKETVCFSYLLVQYNFITSDESLQNIFTKPKDFEKILKELFVLFDEQNYNYTTDYSDQNIKTPENEFKAYANNIDAYIANKPTFSDNNEALKIDFNNEDEENECEASKSIIDITTQEDSNEDSNSDDNNEVHLEEKLGMTTRYGGKKTNTFSCYFNNDDFFGEDTLDFILSNNKRSKKNDVEYKKQDIIVIIDETDFDLTETSVVGTSVEVIDLT